MSRMNQISPQIHVFLDKGYQLRIVPSKFGNSYTAKVKIKGRTELIRGKTIEEALDNLENKLNSILAADFII